MSKPLRPTGTAGDGRQDGKETGEDTRIRCNKCGFYVKPSRDGEGGQVSRSSTSKSATEPAYEESVSRGCPCCGSTNYRGRR